MAMFVFLLHGCRTSWVVSKFGYILKSIVLGYHGGTHMQRDTYREDAQPYLCLLGVYMRDAGDQSVQVIEICHFL